MNALVVAENTGGGTLPVNFTTAILIGPDEAVVGTLNEVITKSVGAVNQYPLTLPGKVLLCAGIASKVWGPEVVVAST